MAENQVINHKCPNCAAPLYYNIENENWICNFCGNTYTVQELLDKLAAPDATSGEQREFLPKGWKSNQFQQEENMQAYVCSNCGGRVISDKNTVATFCAFCHSPAIIADRIKDDLKPDVLIPFKVTQEKAMIEFEKLLRRKPLLPKSFREYIKKGEITGLYAPFWLFSSDLNFNMSIDGEKVSVWTTGEYQYTKTDTYLVDRQGVVPITRLPVDASQRLDNTIMDAIEPYDYSDLAEFDTHYLSGMFAEAYDIHHEESYNRFFNRAQSTLRNMVQESVGGYSRILVRSYNTVVDELEVKYGMFPVWMLSIKYKDKDYIFAINGQTGKSAGRLPVSTARIIAIFGAVALGVGAILSLLSLI